MTSDYYEAVLFFENQSIIKEMRYTEFEAVLDGVVGIPELSRKHMEACFVTLTSALDLTACVLFLIKFDSKGFADSDWNIPLRHLASKGRAGPNLGQGHIRLACKSQCPIAWHQRELWEPPEQGNFDPFGSIQRALSRNKLGFKKVASAATGQDIPVISDIVTPVEQGEATSEPQADRVNQIAEIKQQAANKIKMLEARYQGEMDQISRAFRNEKVSLQQESRSFEHQLREQSVFHDTLKNKFLELKASSDKMRKEAALYKNLLSTLQSSNELLTESKMVFQGTAEAQESALTEKNKSLEATLKEALDDVEQLKEKLTNTETEKRKMVSGFIQQLQDQDLLFVAYHLGAGHISLSANVLQDYLDNPEEFAAQKCEVTIEQYQLWVNHYEMPQCDICDKTLPRISVPADFIAGVHNLCIQHKTVV